MSAPQPRPELEADHCAIQLASRWRASKSRRWRTQTCQRRPKDNKGSSKPREQEGGGGEASSLDSARSRRCQLLS